MLTETLADAEVDIKSLKNIVERKDDELSQSEEQCRHLVRHSDPKINNSIRKISHFRTLDTFKDFFNNKLQFSKKLQV